MRGDLSNYRVWGNQSRKLSKPTNKKTLQLLPQRKQKVGIKGNINFMNWGLIAFISLFLQTVDGGTISEQGGLQR